MTDYPSVSNKRLAGALFLCVMLAGCGTLHDLIGSPATRTPPPPVQLTEPTYTPEPSPGPTSAAELVGTWSDPAAQWTVRFNADGTFGSDYQGVTDFRSGKYEVHDSRLDLIGGDGEVDSGRIKSDSIEFRLGTLKRQ